MVARRIRIISLLTSLILTSGIAAAQSCSNVSQTVDEARAKLLKARDAKDLNAAKELARIAKTAIDDAETAASSCRCTNAANDFSDAAIHVRRSREAGSLKDFSASLAKGIDGFNAALQSMRVCASSRSR